MNNDPHNDPTGPAMNAWSPGPTGWAPNQSSPWGVAIACCALVITGHMLGVAWLAEPVAGLPAGLWVIGLFTALCAHPVRARLAEAVGAAWGLLSGHPSVREFERPRTPDEDSGWWPRSRIASVCLDGLTRLGAGLTRLAWLPVWGPELSLVGDARERLEAWIRSAPWPTRPLRIGLCMPEDEAEALVRAPGASRVEWFHLADWDDPVSVCRRHCFDAAVYHDGEGPVRIVTPERSGHAASIVEWADLTGELTFGKVFPGRVDPAAVVVEGAAGSVVRRGAGLLRALVEAAATLARSEHRLTLPDIVLGRRPTDIVERPAGLSLWRPGGSPASRAMHFLAEASAREAEAWPEASAIGADAAGAFFVSNPWMSPSERLAGLRTLGEASSSCAKTALRLGAAGIASLEDDEAMRWLARADELLRKGATPLAELDHAAFLESELSHGSDDPMGVGRAAAGIALVCAATEPDQLPFVRDDMLEEMAYAGWLVGRDQDRSLLIRVFLEIQHAHERRAKPRRRARRSSAA